jgi:hypothetical protein
VRKCATRTPTWTSTPPTFSDLDGDWLRAMPAMRQGMFVYADDHAGTSKPSASVVVAPVLRRTVARRQHPSLSGSAAGCERRVDAHGRSSGEETLMV